jgi:hypothetical protein
MIQLLVWKNSFGAKAFKHPGHCALGIGMSQLQPKYYVSYWPAKGSEGGPFSERKAAFNSLETDLVAELGGRARTALQGGAAARPGQRNDIFLYFNQYWCVTNRTQTWVKMPDHVIEIPVLDTAANKLGLNEEVVSDWWRVFSAKLGHEHQYQYISKKLNCASMVMAALKIAGATSFSRMPSPVTYYSPNDVTDYVNGLVKKINKRQAVIDRNPLVPAASRGVTYSVVSIHGIDLPGVAEWKRMSAVRVGRRHSQVAQIDRLLGEYWQAGPHWDGQNCSLKSIKLYEMLEQIQSHIATKPNSDRRQAVLGLMKQILDVIKDKADADQQFFDHLDCVVGKELM